MTNLQQHGIFGLRNYLFFTIYSHTRLWMNVLLHFLGTFPSDSICQVKQPNIVLILGQLAINSPSFSVIFRCTLSSLPGKQLKLDRKVLKNGQKVTYYNVSMQVSLFDPIRKKRVELPTELLAMKSRKVASSMFGFMREPLLAPIATKKGKNSSGVYKDPTREKEMWQEASLYKLQDQQNLCDLPEIHLVMHAQHHVVRWVKCAFQWPEGNMTRCS